MPSALLALLTSVVGVSSGWQPLADGSGRYEHVIHVHPQTAAKLRGEDVTTLVEGPPADIAPVARVRIVVSAEPAPRRRRTTLLKPVVEFTESDPANVEATKLDGSEPVLLAQYSQPGSPGFSDPLRGYPATADSRTAASNAASAWNGGDAAAGNAPPYAAAPGGAIDQFGRVVQQSAEELRTAGQQAFDSAGNALRQAVVPTSGQLFSGPAPTSTPQNYASQPTSAAWNGGAATAGGGPIDQFGNQIQQAADRATQPLQGAIADAGDRVRGAADQLGSRTQQMIDQLGGAARTAVPGGYPAGASSPSVSSSAPGAASAAWNGGAAPAASSSIPPTGDNRYRSGASPTAASGSSWNNGSASAAASNPAVASNVPTSNQRRSQPISQSEVGRWNNAAPPATATPPTDPRYPPAGDRWASNPSAPVASTAAPTTAAPSSAAASWNSNGPAATGSPPSLDGGIAEGSSGAFLGDGPAFPGYSPVTTTPAGEAAAPVAGANGGIPAATGAAITSGSFAQSANRPLEGPVSSQLAAAPVAAGTPPPYNSAALPPAGVATSTGAATGTAFDPTAPQTDQYRHPTFGGGLNGGNVAATIAAWVLLCGSAAGNFYLFWSYLDVRNKYRLLVRKTARAVGSRLSAA